MDNEYLMLLLRWLHILSAIAIVGGTMFQLFALNIPVANLPEPARNDFREAVRRRWSKVVMLGILLLLATGLFNWIATGTQFRMAFAKEHSSLNLVKSGLYPALLTTKAIIAFVIFFIASALSGRGGWTRTFRANAKAWLTINLVLSVVVVGISGYARSMHTGPNIPLVQEELKGSSDAPPSPYSNPAGAPGR